MNQLHPITSLLRHIGSKIEKIRHSIRRFRFGARRVHLAARRAHSNPASYVIRKLHIKLNIRRFIGIQLASFTFVASVIIPQTEDISSKITVMKETVYTVVTSTIGEAKYHWPLSTFGISQRFSVVHPGMDLTDPKGTSIHPVADGKVIMIQSQRFGYGNHILVEHADGVKSLYAHLSGLDVKEGDAVTNNSTIGEVGSTGWSTGNHLHLEIYQDNEPINPIGVLPEIEVTK